MPASPLTQRPRDSTLRLLLASGNRRNRIVTSAEREDVGLDAALGELDLERALADRPSRADELVEPWPAQRAVSLCVDVAAGILARRRAVHANLERHRGALLARPEDEGFLFAGASTLIQSLWRVDDTSTVALMESFYTGLLAGQTPGAALRTAQRSCLESGAHPYVWAPFQVVGYGG